MKKKTPKLKLILPELVLSTPKPSPARRKHPFIPRIAPPPTSDLHLYTPSRVTITEGHLICLQCGSLTLTGVQGPILVEHKKPDGTAITLEVQPALIPSGVPITLKHLNTTTKMCSSCLPKPSSPESPLPPPEHLP